MHLHQLWRDGAGWNLVKIVSFVLENKRLEFAAVVLATVSGAKDILSWERVQMGGSR